MLVGLLAAIVLSPSELRILFCGNSHTAVNDVPHMVESIIETRSPGLKVTVSLQMGAMLQDIGHSSSAIENVRNGKWDYVVLQGAGLSQSHKYKHPMDGAVALGKAAKQAHAQTLLFAEWSRRGWNESDYILGVYGDIAKATGAKIVPICLAWDLAMSKIPGPSMWQEDGNHALLAGSYLASLTLAEFIRPSKQGFGWRPTAITPSTATTMANCARAIRER
jgi:hypothetical protein